MASRPLRIPGRVVSVKLHPQEVPAARVHALRNVQTQRKSTVPRPPHAERVSRVGLGLGTRLFTCVAALLHMYIGGIIRDMNAHVHETSIVWVAMAITMVTVTFVKGALICVAIPPAKLT